MVCQAVENFINLWQVYEGKGKNLLAKEPEDTVIAKLIILSIMMQD